uniref:RNA helicase n=1 Tax=Schistocephalus solidus TaxID=70667 RepID=A0A0X3P0Y2_SCHSO
MLKYSTDLAIFRNCVRHYLLSVMSTVEEFHLMNIDQRLLKAISDLRWNVPTDIQQAVIPLILEKKNLSVQARTGSGKTAAFAIPIIHMILESKLLQAEQRTSALIITPTKELCDQITKDVKSLCKYASREVSVVDVAQSSDVDVLRPVLVEKPDIIVGTPFRILAQLHRKRLNFEDLAFLVVDEADLVLAFGYGKDIQELKSYLPKTHLQVILMSATLDETTKELRRSIHTGEWVRVELAEENFLPSNSRLTQYMISAEESSKYAILIAMIRLKLIRGKTMIFTNSIDRCYKLRIFLEEFGVQTVILNSELPIATRCHTVQQFNRGLYDYLLATDENDSADVTEPSKKHQRNFSKDREYGVSRGIDFKLVSNVINFDFPLTAKRYVHRVGRTARADQMGTALSFVSNAEEPRLIEVAALLTRGLQAEPGLSDKSTVDAVFKPYQFRLSEVDGFRYRAADIVGRISRKRIREARLKEIKMELINSERLKGYFADHAADYDALRHDKPLSTVAQPHLKDVPEYMVPPSLQALVRSSTRRTRSRQHFQKRKRSGKHDAPSTSAAGGQSVQEASGHIKLKQLRSHKTKMALARNPAKLAQIKTQLARRRKAANPLFSFGKKGQTSRKTK